MELPTPPGRKKQRTESLAIRLDPKTRFILEFVSRVRGQTITTVVERAIYEAASGVRVSGEDDTFTWQDIWSDNDGTRALRMAAIRDLFPSYEEEKRLNFARQHWPFFFTNERGGTVQTGYVEVLWPRIDEFIQVKEDNTATNANAAAEAMQKALKEAKIEPPQWPPKKRTSDDFGRGRSLDDEIPFAPEFR